MESKITDGWNSIFFFKWNSFASNTIVTDGTSSQDENESDDDSQVSESRNVMSVFSSVSMIAKEKKKARYDSFFDFDGDRATCKIIPLSNKPLVSYLEGTGSMRSHLESYHRKLFDELNPTKDIIDGTFPIAICRYGANVMGSII
uniref:BTB domain-containing protein n=1 Tax=Rhabditophanes sp. KR3021 TaxID=114890 RepID=A0AC35UFE7_9BILA